MNMIRIFDYLDLPFGIQISVKKSNGEFERAISIVNNIAFENGLILPLEAVADIEIYLGWQ